MECTPTMTTILPHLQNKKIKFNQKPTSDFYSEVRRRVDQYFTQNNRARQGNATLWAKSVALLTIQIILYASIISNYFGFSGVFTLYTILGINTCLICFNITHDTLHGSFFSKKSWNKVFGYFFDLNGFSSFVWNQSHNLDHHIFTNIAGVDKDIDKMFWLRLAPTDGYYKFHRFQYLYALPLYVFTTLNWSYYSDIKALISNITHKKMSFTDVALFLILKTIALAIFIFIPMAVLSLPWWQTLISYFSMQMVGGLLAAVVFQLGHVVEGVEYPLPDKDGQIENNWVIHEMKTTSNFATQNTLLSQLFGGLNYQIEHHLFPQVSHVHYSKISPIIQETAKEFGVPYNDQRTFFGAVASHLRVLKKLGMPPQN